MAGIAILVDLWRKHPSFNSANTLHSAGFFAASGAAASAAATVAGTPFASRFFFGHPKVAYCEAGVAVPGDYIPNINQASQNNLKYDAVRYATKEHKIQLKPLYSAFELKTLAITSLRSFLLFYLPLLEPKLNLEDDKNDSLQEAQEEQRVDLVVPFKKSVKQVLRETTVVTTRRVLERLAFHYVSQRVAWKLLKDVPQSATRKAHRGMPTVVYIFRVSRTTLRGHFLGVAAAWLVQFGIEIYRCLSQVVSSKEGTNKVDKLKEAKLLGRKVTGITIRCGASLLFASIGAGLGSSLVRPSIGQWIGCAVGDLAGPVVVSVFVEKGLHLEL